MVPAVPSACGRGVGVAWGAGAVPNAVGVYPAVRVVRAAAHPAAWATRLARSNSATIARRWFKW
jgi:hypothetical protein